MRFHKLTDLDALIIDSLKPTRYVGGEVGSFPKPLEDARLTWALCFPETYEIGMSNVGFRLLHFVLNQDPAIACERVFMPWPDMIARMKARGVPLWSLESRVSVRDFDVIGFSMQFEAGYTSVLEMLSLAGVPLLASQRTKDDPIVIGGGPCAYNPEPIAPFFDAFSIGEGEEQLIAVSRAIEEFRREFPRSSSDSSRTHGGHSADETAAALLRDISEPARGMDLIRASLHRRLAEIPGVYVPSLFRPVFHVGEPAQVSVEPLKAGYEKITRSVMRDLDDVPQPSRPIVPFMQTVHDRLPIEIQRGCVRGCRFCQAGMLTRPSRQRSPDKVLEMATRGLKATGYEEVGFLSLSAGDYGCINELLSAFFDRFAPERVSISLPSLRTETMNEKLAAQIGRVKKSGFTIAPEAATDRLRRVINKGNSEENLLHAVESVFQSGWSLIKLYFMIGLPTETDEDVLAIAQLAKKAYWKAKAIRQWAQIHAAVSTFVPKPFTPFQWDAMIPVEETLRKHALLRSAFPKKGGLLLRYHEGHSSLIEGALARGDRRVSLAVYEAWRAGQILDGWTEHFSFDRWMAASDALEKTFGVSLTTIACRERALDECLPWQMLSCGVSDEFLRRERGKSRAGEVTPTCAFGKCNACGACDFKEYRNRLKADEAAKADWKAPALEPQPAESPAPSLPACPEETENAGAAAEGESGSGAQEASAGNAAEKPKGPARQPPQIWVRVQYAKTGRAIAVSHLETIMLLERALRRAGWPVAFTQGFNPKPRLSFSPACPVGIESNAEFLDVRLTRECGEEWLRGTLAPELPVNFPLISVQCLPEKPEATNEAMAAIRFEAAFDESAQSRMKVGIGEAIRRFCESESVIIRREKTKSRPEKTIELKDLVSELTAIGDNRITFTLRSGNEATAKPGEVIQAIFGIPAAAGEGVQLLKAGVRWREKESPAEQE